MARKKRKVKKPDPNGPARKLIEVASHRTTGGIFLEGITPYAAEHESYVGRYALATLALCHDVLEMKTEPFVQEYQDAQGKKRRYTPDIFIRTPSSEIIIEMKPLAYLFTSSALKKYQEIAAHFALIQKRFAFLVDAQVEDGARFGNVKILFRYAHSHMPEDALQKIKLWRNDRAIPIKQLMELLKIQLVEVYTAIAQKHLCINWSEPVSEDSLVSHPNQPIERLSIEQVLSASRYGPALEQLAMGITPTDKRVLAAGKTWRSKKIELNAFSSTGGFQREKALRDLTQDELRVGTIWSRRDRAPGKAINQAIPTNKEKLNGKN